MDYSPLAKIFLLSSIGFVVALFSTPLLSNFLYKNKLGKNIRNDGSTPLYSKLHAGKAGTPTMGGVLIWGTAVLLAVVFWFLDRVLGLESFHFLNFLTRRETLLPLGAFLGASMVGLLDDWLDVRRKEGLRFRVKIWLYAAVATIGAWWFYYKLEFNTVNIPFFGNYEIGAWFLLFFILAVVATSFAVDLTDGLDGLAGGVLLIAFFAYGLIAYLQGRENLAALIAVVCGSLLAFLWFNVYPARFFMGDTGAMGMGVLLATVAFLTNSVFLLALIGFVFLIEALSVLVQIFSKRVLKKKIFLTTPLHHHFEALGWVETKVTMRLWILSAVFAILGVVVYFIG